MQLIGNTSMWEGLEVHAWLDESVYEKSIKVTYSQLAECRIKRNKIQGEWNYEILPRKAA